MRLGRKADKGTAEADVSLEAEAPVDEAGAESPVETQRGPFDEDDVDTEDREGVDLGSLMVTPAGPMEMPMRSRTGFPSG